jgi:hypothetical protein
MNNIYNIGKSYKGKKYTEVANILEETFEKEHNYINNMCSTWERNNLFYQGQQHIDYVAIENSWRTRKYNKYRSTTNLIRPGVDALVSLLTKQRPYIHIFPNGQKAEDKCKAKFQQTFLEAKWEIDNERDKYNRAGITACILGTVYRKDFWNPNKGVFLKYSELEEESKNEEDLYEDISKAGGRGNPGKYYQVGDTDSKILTPHQLIPDFRNAIDSLDDGYYIIEANIMELDVVRAIYDKKGNGYTGNAKKLNAEKIKNQAMESYEFLKASTEINDGEKLKASEENTVLVLECYLRPNKDIPEGLMIVVAGGEVLYAKESPYIMTNGNWHPYSMFRWGRDTVRHHGLSLVSDAIEPQKRLNAIDTFIVINRSFNAMPTWTVPLGGLIKGFKINNSPGQVIMHKPGYEPSRLPGIPVDASIYKERESADYAVKGAFSNAEILAGQKGSGTYSAALYNLMLEQISSRFSSQIRDFERFIERSQNLKANIYRMNVTEPRPQLINRIKSLNLEVTETEIDDFFNGKMSGDEINISVEAGSMLPRSKVAEQNNVKELMGLGFFGPVDPMQNPKTHEKLAKKFGLEGSYDVVDEESKRARWENDLLRQGKVKDAVVTPSDNHLIHFNIVKEEMNKPEFYTTNKSEVIQNFMEHMLRHYYMLMPQEKQAAGLNEKAVSELDNMAAQFGIGDSVGQRPSLEQRLDNLEGFIKSLIAQFQGAEGGGVPNAPTGPPPPNVAPMPNQ